jgi:TrmH family RNA methyltransferase
MPSSHRLNSKPPRTGPSNQPSEVITSRENRWLKAFRQALQAAPAQAQHLGLEGPHLVEEAFRAGLRVQALLIAESGERHLTRLRFALAEHASAGEFAMHILRTSDHLFSTVSGTETPQGIAVLASPPAYSLDDLLCPASPLLLVLAGVQDPGNIGTAIRSAEAFGATGAIATRGTAHPLSPKSLRASAGSSLRLPLFVGIAPSVLIEHLRGAGINVYAATTRTTPGVKALLPSEAKLDARAALFVGGEGAGLTPEIERAADALIRIPLSANVESLNAGVAASILLYEAARQRGRIR